MTDEFSQFIIELSLLENHNHIITDRKEELDNELAFLHFIRLFTFIIIILKVDDKERTHLESLNYKIIHISFRKRCN